MTSKMIRTVDFPPGCELTLTGLTLAPGLTFEQWTDVGELLTQERGRKELQLFAIQCALGDWINYGERSYGDRHAQAILESGRAYQTLANLAWVTSKIGPERRRPGLSFAHHSAVAGLPPPEADELLDMAEMENATSIDLRQMVQARRDKEDGKIPEEETARRILEKAVTALVDVTRSRQAALIVKHLIKPLTNDQQQRKLFLSEMEYESER